jgi:hypothetical protein
MKISNLSQDDLELHQRDPYTRTSQNGTTSYQGGLMPDAIVARLQVIEKIAKWCMDNHYDAIYLS